MVRTSEYCRKAEFHHKGRVSVTLCDCALGLRKTGAFPTVAPNESVLDIALSRWYENILCPHVQSLFTNVVVLT